MGNKSAIVVVLDRLSAGYVGAYGNAWVTTPVLDQLASQSILIEHPLVASDDIRTTYSHYWFGRDIPSDATSPDMMDRSTGDLPWSLPRACSQRSIHTSLFTDEPLVAQHSAAEHFDEPLLVRASAPTHAATAVSEIQFTGLLAEVADAAWQLPPPYLLWVHARALAGAWDAPYAMRQQLADDDDPHPPTSVVPPQVVIDQSVDPDQLLGYAQSYAAQVEAIDACLAPLIPSLTPSDSTDQTLLVLTSSRGYPLGQHAVVGGASAKPYGDLLHVPLMLRLPQAASAAERNQGLWQPADLAATLHDWFELDDGPGKPWGYSSLPVSRGATTTARDRAVATVGTCAAVRTDHWLLVESDGSPDREAPILPGREAPVVPGREAPCRRQLYVKPDDRWEVNDVSDRLPEVTAALSQVGRETRALFADSSARVTRSAADGKLTLPPLPDEIIHPLS